MTNTNLQIDAEKARRRQDVLKLNPKSPTFTNRMTDLDNPCFAMDDFFMIFDRLVAYPIKEKHPASAYTR